MAPSLIPRVAAGGTLVLSGILADQVEDVLDAYREMRRESVTEEGEWRAIVLCR